MQQNRRAYVGESGVRNTILKTLSVTHQKKMDRNIKTVAQFYTYYYMVKKYITTTINKAFYPEKKRQSMLVDMGIGRVVTCELLGSGRKGGYLKSHRKLQHQKPMDVGSELRQLVDV